MKILYSFLTVFFSFIGYCQTILNQAETASRTVQDPNVVVLAQGFHAASSVSNPFVAKIGTSTDTPNNPTNSDAGSTNPSGTFETDTNRFHDTQGNIDVNGGGQLQYTLPIALPPGVKSVAPQINLVYTSGSGNGIAGYGWNISGITSISRTGRNLEKDGEVRGIKLDYSDYYSFNGQRLILKSGEYGKNGAEYVTEKFSNVKIKSIGAISGQAWQGPEYWEVTFEDGSQAWYGSTPDGGYISARTPIEYNIVKWKDAQGNYINYSYTQANNVAVIGYIHWGGNETLGLSHFNKIVFIYNVSPNEQRNLKEQSYANGVSFVQDQLLNNIFVYTNTDATEKVFKSYSIKYKKLNNSYQFVDYINEKNSEDAYANEVKFGYSEESVSEEYLYSDKDMSKAKKIYADFNLDGITDYIEYSKNKIFYKKSVYINSVPLELSFDTTKFSESDFKLGVPITFKDTNNYVKNLTGIVIPVKINGTNANQKNYELRVYSVDISTQSLKYEFSKVVNYSQYHIYDHLDDGGNTNNQCTLNPTNLTKITTYDYNGDGIDEVMLSFSRFIRCRPRPINPNPDEPEEPQEESRNYYANAFFNFSNEQTLVTDFLMYESADENSYSFASENYGDFDGDGVVDIITNNIGNLKVYNIVKNSNGTFSRVEKATFAQHIDGLYTKPIYGDYNGDGKTDILIPQTDKTSNWFLYLSTGKNFTKIVKNNFIYYSAAEEKADEGVHNTFFESGCSYGTYTYYEYMSEDLNMDGKSEIVVKKLVLRNHQWNSHYDKEYTDLYINVYSNLSGYQLSGDIVFSNIFSKYYNFQDKVIPFSLLTVNKANKQIVVVGQPDDCAHNNCDYNYAYHFEFLNMHNYARIKTIQQGGITTEIDYKELDPNINPGLYSAVKTEQYPYIELDKVSQSYAVSQLRQEGRKQDFKYRGLISHLRGKGMIGFRQAARTNWYVAGLTNTIVWSGAEIDPLNDGVPIKEWSIKTTDENSIFPADISENNTQLLSYKKTDYRTDVLPYGVKAIVPWKMKTKDFLKDTTEDSEITYDSYYLPIQTDVSVNNGLATRQTILSYTHNPSGTGKDYYIGRPSSKTEITKAYNDTKGTVESYSYENNLLSNISKQPYISGGLSIVESLNEHYEHDGWGNIKKKTVSYDDLMPNPALSQSESAQYDDKGRFVIKKTDNLGLETNIEYNDWGQVIKQTDPLGVILTNSYDGWGKLLTSVTNIGGVKMYTNYTYEKLNSGGNIITQYDPDGNVSSKFTNKLGQEFKTRTKTFGQNKYVAKYKVYDPLGRVLQESEPYFDSAGDSASPGSGTAWNTVSYDDNYFPAKVTAVSFNGKQVETLVSGRTTTVKELNGYNRITTKTTDALGNDITSTDKGGTISFSYNAAGQQIKAQYDTNAVTTKYDIWGRKAEFTDPSNGTYKYTYDGLGRITKETSPKGYKKYIYNNLGQLATQQELSNDGKSTIKNLTYTYDSKGLLKSRSGTSNGKAYNSTIAYDSYGRVLSTAENSNGRYFIKKGITYDDKMRVSSYEKSLYSSGQYTKIVIENVYDSWSGELYQVKDKLQNKVLWELRSLNAKGQVEAAYLGKTEVDNEYDSNGFLDYVQHDSQTTQAVVLFLKYNFNAIKNELTDRKRRGSFDISENFEYDDNNRLKNWTDPVTGAFTQNAIRNTYDTKGRITNNDQVGEIKFTNTNKVYQATGMVLNDIGKQTFSNNLVQQISYNENNDPVFIDGIKGDAAFEYGLSSMRQVMHYGGNFQQPTADNPQPNSKFTKYYSEDGSYEVIRDNQTGQEKHILYIGGNPYESNIVYLKNYAESSGSYKFLHKDYLGSVLAITDESGNIVEQRHYDAWGQFTHLKVGNGAIITDKDAILNLSKDLIIDRGYTSHEHLYEVGLIHMNGRLYDPVLRRFLNADENIQDPYNTQNYNKYGYVLNNPLMFNDPSGEFFVAGFFLTWIAPIIWGAIVGAAVGAGLYIAQGLITGNWSWNGFGKSILMGAITGGIGGGLGQVFSASGFWATVGNGALSGAGTGGVTSLINGDNFLKGLTRGAVFGGAVAGISYTVSYLFTNSKTSYMEATDENTLVGGEPTPVGKRVYARELYESQFEQQNGLSFNDIYNRASPGGYMGEDGLIHTKIDGENVKAFGVTKTGKDFISGKIKSKIYLADKAFSSREQLSYVLQHELGHVRIDWSSLAQVAGTKITFKENEPGYLYKKNLNNIGHYYIEESGTNFLMNNGWSSMLKHVPEKVWSTIWYRSLNEGIKKLLEGTDKRININF